MSKHLKKFLLHTDYTTFTLSNDFILPNVSQCNNEIHYNPITSNN